MPSEARQADRVAHPAVGPVDGRLTRRARLLVVLLIVIGTANHARSLGWGFIWDDFFHQLALRQGLEGAPLRPWSLYDFGTRPEAGETLFEAGLMPWWTDADFKVRFFRPISSLSIWLDYRLYDDWAPGYHLTSLLLFAVLLGLAFRLFCALGVSAPASLWALSLLALEDGHFLPVGWIANRNTLLAALFAVATILCVHHQRRSNSWISLVAAVLCFLLGCGSKESGLVVFPLIGLYLLLFDRAAPDESLRQAVARLFRTRVFWLFAFLTAAFLAGYVGAGYGSRSTIYPAPWSDPLGYATRMCVLVPVGLLSMFFGFVADLVPENPRLTWPIVGVAVVLMTATVFVVFRAVEWSRVTAFATGWVLLSLLVESGGDLSDRLWLNASVGATLLMGVFLARVRRLSGRRATSRYPAFVLAGIWILFGVVAPIPMMALRNQVFTEMACGDRERILDAAIDRNFLPRDVFLLNSPSPMLALTMASTWRVCRNDPDLRVFPLQLDRRPLRWKREDERTMTLTSTTSVFLENRFERVFRSDSRPPGPHTVYETAAFKVEPVIIEKTGLRAIRLRFEKSLDDPGYQFLAWIDGGFERVRPPAIGETIELAAADDDPLHASE